MTAIPATDTDVPNETSINNAGAFARMWGKCFAALYNPLFWRTERRGNSDRREQVLSGAKGTVVELGAGTGLNLEHYPESVDLILTEPHGPMADRLEERLVKTGKSARVIRAGAENLPMADASVDTVVSTLVLCTVDDADASLAEAKRILKPGGQLLFIEHVAAEEGRLLRWQQRSRNVWHGFACGCHTDRHTEQSIRDSGLQMEEVIYGELEMEIPLVRPLIWGSATKPIVG